MTSIRIIDQGARAHFAELLRSSWGSTWMVSRGRLFDVLDDQGFIAESDGEWLGYATYHQAGPALEVTTLESFTLNSGVGSALLAACVSTARDRDLARVWLITTNDNTRALRFYKQRGFVIVALYRDAVTKARQELKPEIPVEGNDGIPIRDEMELELPRAEWEDFVAHYGWNEDSRTQKA